MIPINFGQRIERRIDPVGEMELYTFDANTGDQITILMSETGEDRIQPQFKLYNPDGTLVGTYRHPDNALLDSFELTQDGTYTIVASDQDFDQTGDYALNLQRLNNPVNAIPINFGDRIEEGLDLDGEWDTYVFDANSGDRISILMSETGEDQIQPQFKLYNPDGTLVDTYRHPDNALLDSFELTQDGTYTIVTSDQDFDQTGDYALNLQLINRLNNNSFLDNEETDILSFNGAEVSDNVPLSTTIDNPFSTPDPSEASPADDPIEAAPDTPIVSIDRNSNNPTDNNNGSEDSLFNTPIYRFQNSALPGTYLFAGPEESQSIRQNFPNFIEEGQAFAVATEPGDDLIRINRFQNSNVPGTYLYAGETESQSIRQNFSNLIEEGIAFYVYAGSADIGVDIYRFQNLDFPGTYLFIGDEERQNILTNFPNFIEEGVAFEVEI